MPYEANLGGVAQQIEDCAQITGKPTLFRIGELLEHVYYLSNQGDADGTLVALASAVAFSWLMDEGGLS